MGNFCEMKYIPNGGDLVVMGIILGFFLCILFGFLADHLIQRHKMKVRLEKMEEFYNEHKKEKGGGK